MAPTDRSPQQALLHFVERLPTTIRDVVLARCCLAFGRLQAPAAQDLLATFRAILLAPDRTPPAYACAKMVSVVELALACPDVPMPLDFCDSETVPGGDGLVGQGPLTRRHWRAAQEEFARLRSSVLGIRSLSELLLHPMDNELAARTEPHTRTT